MIKYRAIEFLREMTMLKAFLSVLLIGFYMVITGCGTTGPLYIPEQRYPQGVPADSSETPNQPSNQSTQ